EDGALAWSLLVDGTMTEKARLTSGGLELDDALLPVYGGTGLDSYTAGDMLYASDSETLAVLAGAVSGGEIQASVIEDAYLRNDGDTASGDYTWTGQSMWHTASSPL